MWSPDFQEDFWLQPGSRRRFWKGFKTGALSESTVDGFMRGCWSAGQREGLEPRGCPEPRGCLEILGGSCCHPDKSHWWLGHTHVTVDWR